MEDRKIKHSEIKTVEDYKLYKKQKAREYYVAHAEEIKARRRERYYNMKDIPKNGGGGSTPEKNRYVSLN